jgi:diguanylate cyclase (GGDEF)-like protein
MDAPDLDFNILEAAGDLICLMKPDTTIVWASKSFCEAYAGGNMEAVIGQKPTTFFSNFTKSVFYDAVVEVLRSKMPCHRVGFAGGFKQKAGIRGFYFKSMDVFCFHIIKLDTVNAVSSYVPLHDATTSLPNRYALDSDISLFLSRGINFSAMLLDIERFSLINESLGLDAGDQMLMEVSSRLAELKDSGKVYRVNADQFLYLSTDVNASSADAIRLRKAFLEPYIFQGGKYYLSIRSSAFIATRETLDVDESSSSIIQKLELALKLVKKQRSGHAVYSKTMETNSKRKLDLASALKDAIDKNELILEFQPQVLLSTKKVVGVEAFVRWQNPVYGRISPGEFLPIARECGLSVKLDKWVLSQTFNLSRFIQKDFPVDIAINLTGTTLCDRSIGSFIEKTVQSFGVDTSRMVIEITEEGMEDNPTVSQSNILKLRELGFKIAIDDFGVGATSISSLMSNPAHLLKLDRSFVADIDANSKTSSLVANLVKMASALGMKVVAEGVETAGEYQYLTSVGVHMAQGYMFSKPLELGELTSWLKHTPDFNL